MPSPLLRFTLLFSLLFAQQTYAQQAFLTPSPSRPTSIPFRLVHGFLITVEGRVGPIDHLKFILDTGATCSILDRRIAARLSLSPQKGKLLRFNRQVDVEFASLPELQFGPVTATNLRVGIGDLKQFSDLAADADAIIGLDLLRATQGFWIDYENSAIVFRTPTTGISRPIGDSQILTVPALVQGHPAHLVIDTGIQGLFFYASRIGQNNLQLDPGVVKEIRMGKLAARQIALSGIRLGPDDIHTTVLLIDDSPLLLGQNIDGYVGTEALHARKVEFDFLSNTLRWQ